jgi:hypothetical protein
MLKAIILLFIIFFMPTINVLSLYSPIIIFLLEFTHLEFMYLFITLCVVILFIFSLLY